MLLKPNTCKLLLYFMAKCKYDNLIETHQQTIMEDLGYTSLESVGKAIKTLKDLNVIIAVKDANDRRRNVYFLNPYQSWKGEAANRKNYVAQQNKIDPQQLQLPFECKL
jgi:DNA-binding MarR family transcriptional regulator